jgi:glycosyltransferase involved in cell wall biosynthesis
MLTGSFKEVQIRDRIDVLHLTSPLPVRMSKTPTITTIHDIIPLRLPHSTTDKKSEVLGRLRKTIAYSDVLITVSNHSKSDIVDVLDVDPDKIVVTYQPPNMGPLTPAEVENLPARLFKYGLTAGQFLLFAGAIEPKKNLRRLIEAYLEIDTHYPLVIAGPRAWLWEKEVGDLGSIYCEAALRRLKFLGYVSWEDLRALYGGASVFVFPSLYEGYGLPALDALNMGVPTVVSNSASLPEVCGEAALYADPYDRDDLAHQIKRALNDEELRKTLRLSGPQQAARRSFESYATMVSEAYKRVC